MRMLMRLFRMFSRSRRTAGRGGMATTTTRRRGGIGSIIRRFLR